MCLNKKDKKYLFSNLENMKTNFISSMKEVEEIINENNFNCRIKIINEKSLEFQPNEYSQTVTSFDICDDVTREELINKYTNILLKKL